MHNKLSTVRLTFNALRRMISYLSMSYFQNCVSKVMVISKKVYFPARA